MIITKTVTKKVLENLIFETFTKIGIVFSSRLLDSLKLLGFQYATNAGISINIEDLKTPNLKKLYLTKTNLNIALASTKWQQGFLSDTERFQTIIDNWNLTTETLKTQIIDYYQKYDPVNNLYIMAFSGARGNISQVRQLVGIRGLMSDQEGKIIDLPIKNNFREGLSSIDYIISSYGARKGIVDTALKTADSGYLTRRLIYVAQDVIIRQKDCKTLNGITFFFTKKNNKKNLIGRTILRCFKKSIEKNEILEFNNKIITPSLLKNLEIKNIFALQISSILTCKATTALCQKCYGWDLATQNIISLGEAVGIIAAQSIGEPGTQLTMRTFHTGGIFTSELTKQIIAKFSGKLLIPTNFKGISYRTNQGINVIKLKNEINLEFLNWKGQKENIFLENGSYLYSKNSNFYKVGDIIAEQTLQTVLPSTKKLKPVYTSIEGEIFSQKLILRKYSDNYNNYLISQETGLLWVGQGKAFAIPKESKLNLFKNLSKTHSFISLKIVTPQYGISILKNNFIILLSKKQKFILNLNEFNKQNSNLNSLNKLTFKNYQYLDAHSIVLNIGYYYTLSQKIHLLKFKSVIYESNKNFKKKNYYNNFILFGIPTNATFSLYFEKKQNFDNNILKKNLLVFPRNTQINTNIGILENGKIIKKNGMKILFQYITPIFLTEGAIIKTKPNNIVKIKDIIANLINYTQQTSDIIQGLPKIEELIEARIPEKKSYLNRSPAIFFNLNKSIIPNRKNSIFYFKNCSNFIISTIDSNFNKNIELKKSKELEINQIFSKENSFILTINNFLIKNDFVIFKNTIFKYKQLPILYPSIFNKIYKSKPFSSIWEEQFFEKDLYILKNIKTKLQTFLEIKKFFKLKTENINNTYLIFTKENGFALLEPIKPFSLYKIFSTIKNNIKEGYFLDLGEPLTNGVINLHEFLEILYEYHLLYDETLNATIKSLNKCQLVLINAIQSIYFSQGVNISTKHIEIITKQMTSKVIIEDSGDTPLLLGEMINFELIKEIYFSIKNIQNKTIYKLPSFKPILKSVTTISLNKEGFLSSAGFQETKRILTKAAVEGITDWLRGLKESLILGRLIPAGSSFLNYKNYLDNIYLFKH
jgi:hypothetical protein